MKDRNFLGLFLGIAILHILSRVLPGDWAWLHFMTKPAIMISLGGFLIWKFQSSWSKKASLLLGGIIASLAGDVFLMLAGDYFLQGLGSFFVAHLCYIVLFVMQDAGISKEKSFLAQRPWMILPFLAYAGLLMVILTPHLGGMLIPVWAYALIISFMAITALNRHGKTSKMSYNYVFIGAILFVISDSFIAVNKFAFDIPMVDFWVMSTYISAQYLIVIGMMEDFKLKQNEIVKLKEAV